MKRILITGCRGQLGFELQRALAPLGEVIALPREQIDLADGSAIAVRPANSVRNTERLRTRFGRTTARVAAWGGSGRGRTGARDGRR